MRIFWYYYYYYFHHLFSGWSHDPYYKTWIIILQVLYETNNCITIIVLIFNVILLRMQNYKLCIQKKITLRVYIIFLAYIGLTFKMFFDQQITSCISIYGLNFTKTNSINYFSRQFKVGITAQISILSAFLNYFYFIRVLSFDYKIWSFKTKFFINIFSFIYTFFFLVIDCVNFVFCLYIYIF